MQSLEPAIALGEITQSGTGGGDMHLHVHAVNSKGVERMFRDNGHHLVSALRDQRSRFAF